MCERNLKFGVNDAKMLSRKKNLFHFTYKKNVVCNWMKFFEVFQKSRDLHFVLFLSHKYALSLVY